MDHLWGPLLHLVVSAYAFRCFWMVRRHRPALEHDMFLAGISVYIALQGVEASAHIPALKSAGWIPIVSDVLLTLTMSTTLSALAIVVRESKPIVSRFPLILAFLPFLLVPAHAVVRETFVLKDMLYGIYELGAIIIALLIYGLKAASDRRYRRLLYGTIPLILSLAVVWADPVFVPNPGTSWILTAFALFHIPRTYKSIQFSEHEHPSR